MRKVRLPSHWSWMSLLWLPFQLSWTSGLSIAWKVDLADLKKMVYKIIHEICWFERLVTDSRSFMMLLGLESLDESGEITAPMADSIRVYTAQIQELVIARLNAAISCKLLELVNMLHDSYTGHLPSFLYFKLTRSLLESPSRTVLKLRLKTRLTWPALSLLLKLRSHGR